jgi:hypothetical protein
VQDNKGEWAELNNPSEVSNILQASPKLTDHQSPRENTSVADNVFLPVKSAEPFPLGDMSEISSVSNKDEGLSKEEGEHLR